MYYSRTGNSKYKDHETVIMGSNTVIGISDRKGRAVFLLNQQKMGFNFWNMDILIRLLMLVFLFPVVSCDNPGQRTEDIPGDLQEALLFPKGEKIENDHFHGTAWLTSLVTSDSTNFNAVGSVTFEPGARTNWHLHPAGQILLATGGVGYYQEKGSPKRILRKGDVVKCPPNLPHWHGASSDQPFIQIAITGREKGPTEWLQPVTEEEYND